MSWTAPFSLDVTGVDPDIWYSVLIYNVTDEENPTAIPCTDCHSLTQTHYIFSPHYPSPCHKYTFTVIPYNGAGQGEISQNLTAREFLHILCECIGTCNAVFVCWLANTCIFFQNFSHIVVLIWRSIQFRLQREDIKSLWTLRSIIMCTL